MFWASFKVGITTLMDALCGTAAGLGIELGGWVEIDKSLTTSWRNNDDCHRAARTVEGTRRL